MIRIATLLAVSLLALSTVEAIQAESPQALLGAARSAAARGDSETAIALATRAIRQDGSLASAYYLRGREHFRRGQVAASVRDFDRYVELEPNLEPRQWERGIAYFYAGKYAQGARQFELYQTYHANDVENSVWRFLCLVPDVGIVKARESMLQIADDPRVPMMQIYDLYRGQGSPDQVVAAIEATPGTAAQKAARHFYADLYLGLYYEAAGNRELARTHIQRAAQESLSRNQHLNRYMWDVARVHAERQRNRSRPRRTNVILIMADDLGWGDTGFNGNTTIQTPHLDAMAANGLCFRRFYAAAPVCSPTRGSCLTGRHPYRYGIRFANVGHLPAEEWTLAEHLAAAGYRTGHFGKWHLGTLTKTERDANRGGPEHRADFSPPSRHGFQVNFSTESKVPTWDPLLRPATATSNRWWHPLRAGEKAVAYGTAYWSSGRRVPDNLSGDDSRVIMDRAVQFVQQATQQNKPFLAVVWFHAPHLPVVAGPRYTNRYQEFTPYQQHYYGCVTAMDEQIGRLRKVLRELDVAEDTLLFFCSDNGPEGDPSAPGSTGALRGRKRSLFEGGIRVPAVVEWPRRLPGGRRTDFAACTSDYLPTIAAALELPLGTERPYDGVNLLPAIVGTRDRRRVPIAFESSGQVALVGQRYKIIKPNSSRGARSRVPEEGEPAALDAAGMLLFDLQEDPGETQSLASQEPERVAQMLEVLNRWRQSYRMSLAGGDYRDPKP